MPTVLISDPRKRLRDLIPADVPHVLYVDHVDGAGLWLYEQAVRIGIEGMEES